MSFNETSNDKDFTKKLFGVNRTQLKNGMFNRHNSHFWNDKNPQLTWDGKCQVPFLFKVFL